MRLKRGFPRPLPPSGLLLFFVFLLLTPQTKAQNIPQPDGWIKTESNGASIFRPGDLPSGKLYFLILFPDEPLDGKTLTQWLNARIDTILAKSGGLIQRGTVGQKKSKILTCTSEFQSSSGGPFVSVFTAIAPRPGYGRLLVLTTSPDYASSERYKAATRAIVHGFTTSISEISKTSGGPSSSTPSGDRQADAKKKEPPAVSSG